MSVEDLELKELEPPAPKKKKVGPENGNGHSNGPECYKVGSMPEGEGTLELRKKYIR